MDEVWGPSSTQDILGPLEGSLTPQERALLQVLCEQPGRVWHSGELARAVFASDLGVSDLLMDVQVAALRRKLRRITPGRVWIETVNGTSYAFIA